MDISKEINFLVKNWDKIPDTFKTDLHGPDYYRNSGNIDGLKLEEHIVIMLLSRQKPSVEADYSFDEERISLTKTGKVVWGFDSGCSCPSPWHDSYPNCYSCSDSWKEFTLDTTRFDSEWEKEVMETIEEIKKAIV